jgi:hypothetical protein
VILACPAIGGGEYCFLDAWLDFDSHFLNRMGKGLDLTGFMFRIWRLFQSCLQLVTRHESGNQAMSLWN